MVGAVRLDRARLSQARLSQARQGPSADRRRADAAPLFLAAMVQPVGPGGGRGGLRLAGDAPLVGIDLGREPVPDETTACRLRHRLAAHDLGRRLFDAVPRHLAENGLRLATGTIVDAVRAKAGIIAAPSSTKNARKARSRDASNQERQPGVFRHEGAFGPRQPHQADPRGGGAAGQCRRQPARAHDAHARKKLSPAYRGLIHTLPQGPFKRV